MADVKQVCPKCTNIELAFEEVMLVVSADGTSNDQKASCPVCGWHGLANETVAAATLSQFWGLEKVGNFLLVLISRHAAGPLVQGLEFVGLLPAAKTEPDEHVSTERLVEYNEMVQEAKDQVMRAVFEAAVSAAFTTAAVANKTVNKAFGIKMHSALEEAADE